MRKGADQRFSKLQKFILFQMIKHSTSISAYSNQQYYGVIKKDFTESLRSYYLSHTEERRKDRRTAFAAIISRSYASLKSKGLLMEIGRWDGPSLMTFTKEGEMTAKKFFAEHDIRKYFDAYFRHHEGMDIYKEKKMNVLLNKLKKRRLK